ncbi:transport protein particle component [Globomyces pollinis-pini]|nr:transport protein particle component [Globomyces pollinis-pini]
MGGIAESALDYLVLETAGQLEIQSLDQIGYRVGYSLAERMARDRPRFTDTLDIVKFICKDFWILAFQKQIDNLKTNHRGTYVLSDNSFRWLSTMSSDLITPDQATTYYQNHLAIPCGIIRGAMSNLGVNCTVVAEVSSSPSCTFQIKLNSR